MIILLLIIITVLLQPNTDCHHLGTNARSAPPEQGIDHKNFSLLKVQAIVISLAVFGWGICLWSDSYFKTPNDKSKRVK